MKVRVKRGSLAHSTNCVLVVFVMVSLRSGTVRWRSLRFQRLPGAGGRATGDLGLPKTPATRATSAGLKMSN
ncbi:hypothetical protein J6590_022473 [Homalodisca vitripennis]|nr:hypothetical protein J6590_022473 [Homalodisca vitripennis]